MTPEKEGDKRIENNDFEQAVKCAHCHKLFWAKSIHELGNWESACGQCVQKNAAEEKDKIENIKRLGNKVYSAGGQIKGWVWGKDKIYNPDYQPESVEEATAIASGFLPLDYWQQR